MRTGIRIISLDRSLERRAAMSLHAAESGCDWSFFSACEGVVSPLTYASRTALKYFGRELSPSEIGCYASHYKCWEWLVNSEYDQAIILEDDILVDWAVIREMVHHRFFDHGLSLVRLFSTHPVDCDVVKFRFLSPHYHLVRLKNIGFGTQGYIITKEAARILTSKYSKIIRPVDWVLSRFWEHEIGNYCLFPYPIIEKFIPSTIGDQRHATQSLSYMDRATHLLSRARDKSLRLLYNKLFTPPLPFRRTKDVGPAYLISKKVGQSITE